MRKFIFALLLLPYSIFGQGWEKNLYSGGGVGSSGANFIGAHDVLQSSDGSFFILSSAEYGIYTGIMLIHIDQSGNVINTRLFHSGSGSFYPQDFNLTTTNDLIITGYYGSFSNYEYFLATFNTQSWSFTDFEEWGGGGTNDDLANAVIESSDNHFIVTGSTNAAGNGWTTGAETYDMFITKYTPNFTEIWTRYIGGNEDQLSEDLKETTDGGFILVGSTRQINGNILFPREVYLVKTSSSGTVQWSNSYNVGPQQSAIGKSVIQTSDGGYLILGENPNASTGDVFLLKTNSNGNFLWFKTFEGLYAYEVEQTNDGGFILIANNFSTNNEKTILIKTDSNGNQIWKNSFSEGSICYSVACGSVRQTSDGGFIFVRPMDNSANEGVYVVKTDANGNSTTTFEINFTNKNLIDIVDVLGKDVNKKKYNTPLIYLYDDGTVEKKLIIE